MIVHSRVMLRCGMVLSPQFERQISGSAGRWVWPMEDDMTELEQLKAQIAALEAQNAALRATQASKLTVRVSKAGAVSVYGLGRWPTTLYAGQWARLLDAAPAIRQFIVANRAQLAVKETAEPEKVPSLADYQAAQERDGLAS
jgi:hypothetical protein